MGGYYPYYYPRYPTYGYGASYNPWTGAYRRSAVAYGPYGGAGLTSRYNPRTGAYGQTRQGSNVYGSWGATSVQRGDQWAQTARYTNRATGTTTRGTRTSEGGAAITRRGPGADSGMVRTGSGDVYAGRDGNVYRRQDGSWQRYDNGSWGSVDGPQARAQGTTPARDGASQASTTARSSATTMDHLNRDSMARSEGRQRSSDYSRYRSSGGSRSSASSYRSSGGFRGGARGGGRRR